MDLVAHVGALGGQTTLPEVVVVAGDDTAYERHADRVSLGEHFMAEWPVHSAEAAHVVAHELGHRALGHDRGAMNRRAMRDPRILAAVLPLTALFVVAEMVAVNNYQWQAYPAEVGTLLSPFLSLCVAAVTGALLIRGTTQKQSFAEEYAADDYATDVVGAAGLGWLDALEPRSPWLRWIHTHPTPNDRAARQRAD